MQSPYHVIPDIPLAMYKSHINILMDVGQMNPEWKPKECHQEYFEVQIHEDKSDDADLLLEKNIDDILNLNKYTCHICNIDVPKSYIREHNNSSKHRTCSDIANLALERIKLQMQMDIDVPRKIEILETYFCDPCASVVLNTEKEKHKMTKIHRISLKHDELLSDLLKIYSDIDNVEVSSEIDELELFQQEMVLDTLEEESVSHDIKTHLLDLIKKLMSAGDEFKSISIEISQVKELVENVKIETAKNSNVLLDRPNEHKNNELNNEIDDSNNRVDELNNQSVLPISSRKGRKRASKKFKIQKKKNEFHNQNPSELLKNTDGITATAIEKTNDILKDDNHSSAVTKETGTFASLSSDLSDKIDAIISKYFDSTRTVDALKTEKQHNKTNRELSKNTEQNEKEQSYMCAFNKEQIKKDNENAENHQKDNEQNINHKHQNEINKGNININNNEQNKSASEEQNRNKIEQPERGQEQNNNKNTEQNKNENMEHDNKRNTIVQSKKQDKIDIKEPNVVYKPNESQAPNFSLVYYLKDISRRCQTKPIHTVEAITDNIVQITATNGDKVKISVNNFHSFHMKSNDIYCKVCESPNVRRPEWHIVEGEHRAKVMIPINDANGIRQLDDIWSHCILCNDITKDIDFHLQSVLHKNKLKHCLVKLGTNEVSDDDSKAQYKEQKNTTKGAFVTTLILKNHLVVTNKNYLNCVICDVIVNYDLLSVQQHINSFDHLNNFERQQNENKLIDVDTDKFYCIGCDVHISKTDNVSHCNGKKHKKLLHELLRKQGDDLATEKDENEVLLSSISQCIKKQFKDKMNESELICFVCNMIIYSIDEHMDTFQHKKSYLTYLEDNKLNEIEADTFFCIPCNTVITIDYLMSHCMGRKHKQALRNFTGGGERTSESVQANETRMLTRAPSISQIPRSVATTKSELNDKTMRLKVLYQFREMSDPTKLLCTVCDEEVMYSRKLAQYHISTLDHVVAFNLMMLWNKIKKRDNKYYCDICRLDMTYFSEITHVLGKQHAANLEKEPKGTVYEYDRTLVTHAYAMSHKVGDRTRPSSIISVKPHK